MNETARRIRNGIFLLAAVLLLALLGLRLAGADVKVLRIFAISAGLLVTMLFVTYRALLKTAEAAKAHAESAGPVDLQTQATAKQPQTTEQPK